MAYGTKALNQHSQRQEGICGSDSRRCGIRTHTLRIDALCWSPSQNPRDL